MDNIEEKKFIVLDKKYDDVWKIIQEYNQPGGNIKDGGNDDNNDDFSLELLLLIVSSIRQSCVQNKDKIMKDIFKKGFQKDPEDDSSQKVCGAKVICDPWRLYAQESLEMKNRNNKKKKATTKNDASATATRTITTEELLLCNIMHLIADCSAIKKAKQLRLIKEKYYIDWETIVKKVKKSMTTKE